MQRSARKHSPPPLSKRDRELLKASYDPFDTISVNANGLTFHVMTAGEGRKLALCLHGFPESSFSWRYQIPLLAHLGYRVWAPDLRGYGASDAPSGVAAYKLELLLADVAGLIEAAKVREGITQTLLIGHDWGGVLAWLLAMQRPDLLQKLVVMNLPHPACFLRELKHGEQRRRSWYVLAFQFPWLPEFLLRLNRAWAVGQMILRTAHDKARFPHDVIDFYRNNAAQPGRLTAMLNWYRAFVRHGGFKSMKQEGWPMIEAPVLLIWGDQDTALSIKTLDGTERYVKDLTVRVLTGVSHWVQQEAPEQVNLLLSEWLHSATEA